MQPTQPPMRVCGRCGAAWTRRSSSCLVCGESALSARELRLDPELAWVRITASFQCRSCGQRSPLDGFDTDGTVSCAGCGLTQAFYVPVYEKLFHFAHGLADLGFPLPQGRNAGRAPISMSDNPFFEAGESRVLFPFENVGLETIDGVVRTASLFADVALGMPLCESCKQPYSAERRGDELRLSCGMCGTSQHFRMPQTPGPFTHRPVAIVSDDTRSDGTLVRTEANAGGAVAIRCPSCNAGLDVGLGQSLVVCGYCRTSCRIPARTLHALRPGIVPPRPFWAAFVGPSDMRASLEKARVDAMRALESSRSIEAFRVPEPTPRQRLAKLSVTAVLLLLVGLAFVPRMLALVAEATAAAEKARTIE